MKVVSALPAKLKTTNFTPHPAQSPNALPRESSYSLQLPPLLPVLLLPIFLNVMEGQTDQGKHLTSSVTHSLQRGLIFHILMLTCWLWQPAKEFIQKEIILYSYGKSLFSLKTESCKEICSILIHVLQGAETETRLPIDSYGLLIFVGNTYASISKTSLARTDHPAMKHSYICWPMNIITFFIYIVSAK